MKKRMEPLQIERAYQKDDDDGVGDKEEEEEEGKMIFSV